MAETNTLVRQPAATPVAHPAPAPRKLSLRQNFSWMFCAQMISGVLRWGLLLLLAKMGGALMVGTWTLAQAICLPIMYLTGLNLQTVLVTDAAREHTVGEYLFLRVVTNVVMVGVVVSVCLWQGLDAYTTVCIVLFSISTAILAFRHVVMAVPIRNENTKVNARSQLVLSVLTFAAVGLVLWLTGSLVWALVTIVAVRFAVMAVHDLPAALISEKQYCPDALGTFWPRYGPGMARLAWVALPAGLSVAAITYANNVPIYFLEHYFGRETTGHYGGLNAFVAATNLVLTPLLASVSPRLSRFFVEGRRRAFLRLTRRITGLFVLGSVVVLIVSSIWAAPILRMALNEEYVSFTAEFVWIMALGGMWAIFAFFSHVLQTTRQFWFLLGMQLLMLLASVLLSAVLVPAMGLWGVIYTRLIGLAGGLVIAVGLIGFLLVTKSGTHEPTAPPVPQARSCD